MAGGCKDTDRSEGLGAAIFLAKEDTQRGPEHQTVLTAGGDTLADFYGVSGKPGAIQYCHHSLVRRQFLLG